MSVSRNMLQILICIAYQRNCFIIIDLNVVATNCPVGFTGKYCEKQCSYPHYGIGCQQSCSCSKPRCNASTGCHFIKTGTCIWLIKNEKKKPNILKTQTEFNAYIIYVAHTLSICIGYLLFVNTTSSIST